MIYRDTRLTICLIIGGAFERNQFGGSVLVPTPAGRAGRASRRRRGNPAESGSGGSRGGMGIWGECESRVNGVPSFCWDDGNKDYDRIG